MVITMTSETIRKRLWSPTTIGALLLITSTFLPRPWDALIGGIAIGIWIGEYLSKRTQP